MTVAPTRTSLVAILSLAFGAFSMLTMCFCYGLPFNVVGIVLGVIALVQCKADPDLGGRALAWAGIGVSVLTFVLMFGVMAMGLGVGILGAIVDAANH